MTENRGRFRHCGVSDLSTEVILQVFNRCPHRTTLATCRMVCRDWDSIIVDAPEFWTDVYVGFSCEDTLMVERYLRRSKMRNLTITFQRCESRSNWSSPSTRQILRLLLGQIARWEVVSFHLRGIHLSTLGHQFCKALEGVTGWQLKQFTFSHGGAWHAKDSRKFWKSVLSAPALQDLTWRQSSGAVFDRLYRPTGGSGTSTTWKHLTHLILDQAEVDHIITLLTTADALKELCVEWLMDTPILSSVDTPRLLLGELRTLRVDTGFDSKARLLGRVHTPALEHLVLVDDGVAFQPVIDLLERDVDGLVIAEVVIRDDSVDLFPRFMELISRSSRDLCELDVQFRVRTTLATLPLSVHTPPAEVFAELRSWFLAVDDGDGGCIKYALESTATPVLESLSIGCSHDCSREIASFLERSSPPLAELAFPVVDPDPVSLRMLLSSTCLAELWSLDCSGRTALSLVEILSETPFLLPSLTRLELAVLLADPDAIRNLRASRNAVSSVHLEPVIISPYGSRILSGVIE
ncbi:hypothetical protein VNI00_004396 [Paramarasmius palmivorus]|uniref:F-box domain-containing protein n=1 Tax=Paramarasmius palmivorus TaxID=297713 RepID=A0AAW0DPS7_9AGAR